MPRWYDIQEAARFWDPQTAETDLISLPAVAIVLRIGRNKMHCVPLKPVVAEKRRFYRKADVVQWMAQEAENPGGLLEQLRAVKRARIRKRRVRHEWDWSW